MDATPVTIYRLRVAMADITPPIWRVVDVPADFSLDWLHDVIQWSMGWEHEHPYRFYGGEFAYVVDPDVQQRGIGKELDATQKTLEKLYGPRGRYLRYVYDMGAHWWHHVWLEDVFVAAPEIKYPRLVDGRRASPPEGFGGVDEYRAYLRGEFNDDDDRLADVEDFDPEDFDPTPRPFPNARIYEEGDEPAEPTRPVAFNPPAAEMLGEMYDRVEQMLDSTGDPELRADLRRALEDVVLAEDALPPKSADTLQKARSENPDIEEFLLDCVRNCEQLEQNNSTAPLHAAHLLSFWKVDEAIDAFEQILRGVDDSEEGLVGTMLRAMIWSGPSGVERLLEIAADLDAETQRMAADKLCRRGVRDDRLFALLRRQMADASPTRPNVPYLLSQYDDERAVDLLYEALDGQIEFLQHAEQTDDDEHARRADYALFLTEMLVEAGESLDEERCRMLEEVEQFFWPSEGFRRRVKRLS